MKKKILISSIAAVSFTVIFSAVVFLTPVRNAFFDSGRRFVDNAIASGRMEINSKNDIGKYFEFMAPEEAEALLKAENDAGKFIFLMPQFDLNLNGSSIEIAEVDSNMEGSDIRYIGIRGIPTGSKVYADLNGFVTGEYIQNVAVPYLKVSERVIAEDPGMYDGVTKNLFISSIDISEGTESLFLSGVDEVFRRADLTTPLAVILSEKGLSEEVSPYQLSLSVDRGADRKLADLDNVLRSRSGKIVMIRR